MIYCELHQVEFHLIDDLTFIDFLLSNNVLQGISLEIFTDSHVLTGRKFFPTFFFVFKDSREKIPHMNSIKISTVINFDLKKI